MKNTVTASSVGRRNFLGMGAAGVALGSLSLWAEGASVWAGDLQPALDRARRLGKPLLVLLVPADPTARRSRGALWGECLSAGEDELLADLALCEVAFANSASASVVAGDVAVDDTALAVLVETDGSAGAKIVRGEDLPETGGHPRSPAWDTKVRARIAAIAERVHEAVLPDDAALARRHAQCVQSITREQLFDIVAFHASDTRPKLGHVDRAAAMARNVAEQYPDRRDFWMAALANAAALRLWERDPEGATWRVANDYCPPCGMAYTPEISRHFLELYVD